jgi:hypothetical protein
LTHLDRKIGEYESSNLFSLVKQQVNDIWFKSLTMEQCKAVIAVLVTKLKRTGLYQELKTVWNKFISYGLIDRDEEGRIKNRTGYYWVQSVCIKYLKTVTRSWFKKNKHNIQVISAKFHVTILEVPADNKRISSKEPKAESDKATSGNKRSSDEISSAYEAKLASLGLTDTLIACFSA